MSTIYENGSNAFAHVSLRDPELDSKAATFTTTIKDYYNNKGSLNEKELLSELIDFLLKLPDDIHLFCNEKIYTVSVFTLTLFSFNIEAKGFQFKEKINSHLSRCPYCIESFSRGKAELLDFFGVVKDVADQYVTRFNDIISRWRSEILLMTLKPMMNQNLTFTISDSILNGIFECLTIPQYLRNNQELRKVFDPMFEELVKIRHPLLAYYFSLKRQKSIVPGVLFCWIEGNECQINWAQEILKEYYMVKYTINKENFTPQLLDELSLHYTYVQNPNNFNRVVVRHYWMKIVPILQMLDIDIIETYFVIPKNISSLKQSLSYNLTSIYKLLLVHTTSQYLDKPIDIILRAFNVFLDKLGSEYWNKIEPFTFHNILDVALDRNSFIHTLLKCQTVDVARKGLDTSFSSVPTLTDIIAWTVPLYNSLTDAKKIQMVRKVATIFLRTITEVPQLTSITKAFLLNGSTPLLDRIITISEEDRKQLYNNPTFETILYTKADCRELLNLDSIQKTVILSAISPEKLYSELSSQAHSSISEPSLKVIFKCIEYDILLLSQAIFKLYRNKETINEVKVSTKLISTFTSAINFSNFSTQWNISFCSQFLNSLRNVNGLLTIDENIRAKFCKDQNKVKSLNRSIGEYVRNITTGIKKLTMISPTQFKMVLQDAGAVEGYWSCVFASDVELYQSAIDLLYETFDVDGRLEGLHELLSHNISIHLDSVNLVLEQLTTCKFFEPCPRAVRVLMDIMVIFGDPLNGILSDLTLKTNTELCKEIRKFWADIWSFLDFIYKETLNWASIYPMDQLADFTKDTLDLSNMVIDSYRMVFALIGDRYDHFIKGSPTVFQNTISTFESMLFWLRLNDEYLLSSCVKLITSAVDIAQGEGLTINDSLVEKMARYAVKAKKFSNKLSETQATDILSRAKQFNTLLVESVINEVETQKREKMKSIHNAASPTLPLSGDDRVNALLKKTASFTSSLASRPKSRQPQITQFGSLVKSLPKKQVTHQPLSKMELVRRELLMKRQVHPAGNSVFNPRSKKGTTAINSSNADSDSSNSDGDSDDENALQLFKTAKSKSDNDRGPILLDINGKSIKQVKYTKRIDQAKLDEENMRKRLNVDLNPFYSQVLTWDYTRVSEYPSDDLSSKNYSSIKDQFSNVVQYQSILQPLLLLECWQGLCASRDREDFKPFKLIVGNKAVVSDFYEVYASVSKKTIAECGISDNDLIVLAHFDQVNDALSLRNEDFKKASISCLAKVRNIKHTRGENVDFTFRVDRGTSFNKFLTSRNEVFACKVMQMTTVEREYSTLFGLPFYDLVYPILKATPSMEYNFDENEISKVKENYKLNYSQAQAIVGSVHSEGFSLVQGPPGTGKTKTILGIVGYFLIIANKVPSNTIVQPSDGVVKGKKKVLICAPSNAAVDELVIRLRQGVFNERGELTTHNLVRVGRSDAVNTQVKDLTLEELVDKAISIKTYDLQNDTELKNSLQSTINERKKLREKLDESSKEADYDQEEVVKYQLQIRELSKKINELGKKKDEIRERNSINFRNKELEKRRAQARILSDAEIICSTLSGSAHEVLSRMGVSFDTVIIDEACQCTELSSIIPLRYGAKRCIMVGDPNQLPPTVLSGAASSFKYNQSLFVRMEKHSKPYLLDVQYRMNPLISRFPSSEFYNGELKDGPNLDVITKREWHRYEPFTPYKFFDIIDGYEKRNAKTMSFVNPEEIKVALELVGTLFSKLPRYDFKGKIGIISPYREQMFQLKRSFINEFGRQILNEVDFNTIDGFQGQEKEVIIISCVRADDNSNAGVGFLKDFRRMNVALTRAKCSMWILGHHKSLVKNRLWRDLIMDAKERSCLDVAFQGFLNTNNKANQKRLEYHRNVHRKDIVHEQSLIAHSEDGKVKETEDDYDPLKLITSQYTGLNVNPPKAINNANKNKRCAPVNNYDKSGALVPVDEPMAKKSKIVKKVVRLGTKKKSSIFNRTEGEKSSNNGINKKDTNVTKDAGISNDNANTVDLSAKGGNNKDNSTNKLVNKNGSLVITTNTDGKSKIKLKSIMVHKNANSNKDKRIRFSDTKIDIKKELEKTAIDKRKKPMHKEDIYIPYMKKGKPGHRGKGKDNNKEEKENSSVNITDDSNTLTENNEEDGYDPSAAPIAIKSETSVNDVKTNTNGATILDPKITAAVKIKNSCSNTPASAEIQKKNHSYEDALNGKVLTKSSNGANLFIPKKKNNLLLKKKKKEKKK
ncbi:related to Helicase SEN1 [Saccharomycodes ludwigii]|uniref:Related to Helicase SEN1 n=1 Tax=Saccharomycodes ludwigii TaxID=36035 RepID=A0A376B398_9ASCO|nr:related to Helicase SEN1 [Saccharomycodes ludwigii]